jgi:hypothetical protein
MDRNSAEQLMGIYGRISAGLNEANDVVRLLPETERVPHLHALGSVMADLWLKLQLPIVREHRELDPDGDRFYHRRERTNGERRMFAAPRVTIREIF